MAPPSLVVFGPQTTWPSPQYLFHLRAALLQEPRLQTFLTAIKELPDLWHTLTGFEPRLRHLPGLELLNNLQQWIDHGEFPSTPEVPTNLLCTPLTIIIHMVQYFQYLDNNNNNIGPSHGDVLQGAQSGGIQGFCTGLLTAVAVSCSKNEEDANILGGVALRLAVCIGAFVDLEGAFAEPPNETCCLAVRWKPDASKGRVPEILKSYPDAYISVITDSTSVTVTTPKSHVTSLTQQLSTEGFTVKLISLHGRFHSSVHKDALETISKICDSNINLQFPAADHLLVPLRSNSDAQIITKGTLHRIALKSILTEMTNWHSTILAATSQLISIGSPSAVVVGLVDPIPSSIARESGLKITRLSSLKNSMNGPASSGSVTTSRSSTPIVSAVQKSPYPDHAIAVVGMACKFPGADSIDEFWQLIHSGTSMHQEMPAERFSTQGLRRTPDGKLRFWGNFVRDIDAFDHRFFKKSSREAASMDPQQRLLLQVAYEAMESSGYFGELPGAPSDTGCFLGICGSDYNDNVASHPPNAFSSLGTLRAFLSGKISHFFGWTGPSVTYDTACSSSAVAIHAACKAIELGECSKAVAGGASLYTSPNFYQNLAAASFLSPTGATKPFDAKGDGYCRGEGVGLVVLKKLSAAVADGDTVLGVIAGSAVNQNSNATSITVPDSLSQIQLYKKVSSLAGIDPMDISFVEAHGTGTPVGDPIEFESIRKVFGSPQRSDLLHVASVKGNIGHLEGASGVAALIKTLLMMQHKTIPIQANFTTLNPKIQPLESDRMAIPLSTQNWDIKFKAVCINNYGAAGSNAAMIVCQPPLEPSMSYSRDITRQNTSLASYPIFVSANSATSLMAYCNALRNYIAPLSSAPTQQNMLSSLAFNLADKQNRSLPHLLTTTAATLSDLDEQLAEVASGSGTFQSQIPAKTNSVVLAFGGQVSNTVGLSEDLYHGAVLLRSHLDHCDAILRADGLTGLFPGIFQTKPIENIISLHAMLFSLQYSCAKSWMDSGLQVDAVIGHSFGQLTALCVSGSLSLEDGLKLVCGRASIMQEQWGPERGAMIAIEADIDTVMSVVSSVNMPGSEHQVEIACYNGLNSHVLVGTKASIEAVEEVVANPGSLLRLVKYKKINVTHGFHSKFTEPLLPGLTRLAEQLVFSEPKIPLETCSNDHSWSRMEPQLIAEHTRSPVYFGKAVERLAGRLGSCTWLEAGSGSSVTNMIRRTLGTSSASSHSFQTVQMNNSGAMGSLADVTRNLWMAGHKVQFWPFNRGQKSEYSPINLPPYQFEKSRHWLTWVDTPEAPPPPEAIKVESEHTLLSFVKFQDQSQAEAEFCVDPRSEAYKLYVKGHAVLANPLCPAPLYVELVSQAAMMLETRCGPSTYIPCVEDLEIKAPLGMNVDRGITISVRRVEGSMLVWSFDFTSQGRDSMSKKTGDPQQHATGRISLHEENPGLLAEFSRYERMTGNRYDDLKNDQDSEAIQGSMVYKVFAKVVQYADYYKGVRSVFSKNREVLGHVVLPRHNESALNNTVTSPLAIDNFVQVAGLHVNSLNECDGKEVFVCTKVDRIQPSRKFNQIDSDQRNWIVYSNFAPISGKEVVNDIFVFDSASKELVLIVFGAHFTKVLINSLTKVLSRASTAHIDSTSIITTASGTAKNARIMPGLALSDRKPVLLAATNSVDARTNAELKRRSRTGPKPTDVDTDLRKLLNRVTDVPMEEVQDNSTLDDLGIDSLMVTEVLGEIRKHFDVDIPLADFQNLPDVKSLVNYLVSEGDGIRDAVLNSDSSSSNPPSVMSGTPVSSGTAATSVNDLPVSHDSVVSRLAKLVAGHLETTVTMSRETNLADQGLDSLLSIELASDIKESFGAVIDMSQLDGESTFGDLFDMVLSQNTSSAPAMSDRVQSVPSTLSTANSGTSLSSVQPPQTASSTHSASLVHAQQAFEQIRYDYDKFTQQTGFADFWKQVYPTQARLVLAYVVEAFATLGCPIASLKAGERVPPVKTLPQHALLLSQLNEILQDARLISLNGVDILRSDVSVDSTPSSVIYEQILPAFPQHASEHKLLHITGSKLAQCLTGTADPLQLLFRSKENRELLEDVYTNGPMYEAITKLLGSFLVKAYGNVVDGGKIHVLELGGGTGGTTKYIVDYLIRQAIPFTYTFTDISGSLVAAARKKFAGYECMDFMVLDIEKEPPERFAAHFHTIISTNCIHATKDLTQSTSHIRRMLRSDGFVSLVEFTKNMFWFDLVFGLLDGWWRYQDGRKHVLAHETFWDSSMKAAGFKHVTWTDGSSLEARTLRVITGFCAEPESDSLKPTSTKSKPKSSMETVVYKQVGQTSLCADIYYPDTVAVAAPKRPIALMIHGGGHIMLSRKDIRPKQTQLLLDNGLLPVSIDYRLCPEVNLLEGPMTDVCDALEWARHQLPALKRPGVEVDGDKVVVVGWSTGGHLAMTLAWTTRLQNLKPPDAILAFYCPTDYEDDCWKRPNFPEGSAAASQKDYDLLEGVHNEPITSYNVPPSKHAVGGWMSPTDPRSQLVLHMNWKGQTLPILLGGLPSKNKLAAGADTDPKKWSSLDQPSHDKIVAASPLAQILRNNYRTPTFLVHGTADDLIPWQQTQRVHDALVSKGVPAEVLIREGAVHLFDLYRDQDGTAWEAVRKGYEFLFEKVG